VTQVTNVTDENAGATILGNPRGEGQRWAGCWDRQSCALDTPGACSSFHRQQTGADGQTVRAFSLEGAGGCWKVWRGIVTRSCAPSKQYD
jgi:hypothetical protein